MPIIEEKQWYSAGEIQVSFETSRMLLRANTEISKAYVRDTLGLGIADAPIEGDKMRKDVFEVKMQEGFWGPALLMAAFCLVVGIILGWAVV